MNKYEMLKSVTADITKDLVWEVAFVFLGSFFIPQPQFIQSGIICQLVGL